MEQHEHRAETLLAYVAGLFDGEGCVNFTKSGQSRTLVLRVMLRNTDRGIIEFLRAQFGGRVETAHVNPRWKRSYCWRLDGAAGVEFLTAIEPWVKIKGEQILVAKAYDAIRNRGNQNPGSDHYDAMKLLHEQLMWLNRKGPRAYDDQEPIEACLATLPVPVDQILSEVGYAAH